MGKSCLAEVRMRHAGIVCRSRGTMTPLRPSCSVTRQMAPRADHTLTESELNGRPNKRLGSEMRMAFFKAVLPVSGRDLYRGAIN